MLCLLFFFFNDTATTEIYTLSLHDALPIYGPELYRGSFARPAPDLHGPAGLRGKALDHWQTQARAATDLLGREERIECSCEGRFVHSGSAVADRDDNITAGRQLVRRTSISAAILEPDLQS